MPASPEIPLSYFEDVQVVDISDAEDVDQVVKVWHLLFMKFLYNSTAWRRHDYGWNEHMISTGC